MNTANDSETDELPTTVQFSEGHRGNIYRKLHLELQKLINCSRCPYHRRENETRRKRDPHDKRIEWKKRQV